MLHCVRNLRRRHRLELHRGLKEFFSAHNDSDDLRLAGDSFGTKHCHLQAVC